MSQSLTKSLEEGQSVYGQDGPWFLAPCNRLSRLYRWFWALFGPVAIVLWSIHRNHVTQEAWGLPDVRFYLDMAHGRYDLVPQPFTSRPLAPFLARLLAHAIHGTVEAGFAALAIPAVACASAVVYWLLLRSAAPRWILLAVLCLPFWPQLLSYTGLPDPLYTALLALLLVALEYDRVYLAASIMLPLMLARESTSLTLICLLLVGWRRLGWGGCALAFACTAAGGLIVQQVSVLGLANPEQLSGGLYMLGKVVSNSMRTIGLVPWSNVYPVLCPAPAWQMPLSIGRVHSIGVCFADSLGPMQACWAFLTTFGVLPLLLLTLLKRRVRKQIGPASLVVRFCGLYGGISLLLAPTLGTWYARLFAYAWPLLLVAMPRLYGKEAEEALPAGRAGLSRLRCAAMLVLHLCLCAVGIQVETLRLLALVCGLQMLGAALILVQFREAIPAPNEA